MVNLKMGKKHDLAKNPNTDSKTLHKLAYESGIFGIKIRKAVAAHKNTKSGTLDYLARNATGTQITIATNRNTKPRTLDFLAKKAIRKEFVVVPLALSVIKNQNTSDETLQWLSDLITPQKESGMNILVSLVDPFDNSGTRQMVNENKRDRGNIANRAAIVLMNRNKLK